MRKNKDNKITLFFPGFKGKSEACAIKFKLGDLKQMYKDICKPCWELKYCPYGSLAEGYPLPDISRCEAIEHNDYLKKCLKSGLLGDGRKIDPIRKKIFEEEVKNFSPNDYVENIPEEINYMSCGIFGHLCPVFFSAEGFTETVERRRQTRSIPRDVLIRVVRRDDSTCQECSKKLLDKDIEIDHVIPISRGGATIESNLRVLCVECNKKKSNQVFC